MQPATRQLEQLRDRVRALGSPAFTQKVVKTFGALSIKLVSDEFREQRDPYGKPWEPLKHRQGRILLDTARMRNAYVWVPVGDDGFRVRNNVTYTAHHQYGVPKAGIPKRQMMPETSTGGPGPIWDAAYERTANRLMREQVRV